MRKTPNLNRCKCGGKPFMDAGYRWGFWFVCKKCGKHSPMKMTKEDAVESWNSGETLKEEVKP